MAGSLGLSPTYLSKVTATLVRSGILRAHRGARGGVTLADRPDRIRLVRIVEALQGPVVGPWCRTRSPRCRLCGFHRAMSDVHEATVGALSAWTLEGMASEPARRGAEAPDHDCLSEPVHRALRAEASRRPS